MRKTATTCNIDHGNTFICGPIDHTGQPRGVDHDRVGTGIYGSISLLPNQDRSDVVLASTSCSTNHQHRDLDEWGAAGRVRHGTSGQVAFAGDPEVAIRDDELTIKTC